MCFNNFGCSINNSYIRLFLTDVQRPPQKFAIEPADRTAIVGKPAVLPCRVLNKVGTLQWTRDGFGLGSDRELKGFPRYTMVGSDDEGKYSNSIFFFSLSSEIYISLLLTTLQQTQSFIIH